MATKAAPQWSHAVPLDRPQYDTENDRPRAASATRGNYAYRDPSNYAHGGVGKRPSEPNMRMDNNGQRSREPSQSIPKKRSAKPLRQEQKPAGEQDEGWIHRDKLREIEIQEMEQAGMRVRQPRRSGSAGPGASRSQSRSNSRSMSRSGLRKPMSREQLGESPVDDAGFGDYKRKRVSTIPAADASEEQEAEYHHRNDSELRDLELGPPQAGFRQHSGRPSTSRIPVSKVSPLPVPHAVVDRESPLPRSRHGSAGWSGNWEDLKSARMARSGSVGSQVLLDDDGFRTPSRPQSSHYRAATDEKPNYSHSPPKARVPSKDTPTSGGRKTSGARPPTANAHKPRVKSGASIRPISRSGPPNPINRPEGEAPWLANMYKPDPRLPPDQQMLPTHAKRMAQEQDPDEFHRRNSPPEEYPPPPADHNAPLKSPTHLQPSPTKTLQPPSPNPQDQRAASPTWPLRTASHASQRAGSVRGEGQDQGSPRPGTSGGYRITPTINTNRPNLQKVHTSERERESAAPHNPTPRVPDFDLKEEDEPKKKKGCMGCVVM